MIDYLKVLGTSKYINLNALCVPVVELDNMTSFAFYQR